MKRVLILMAVATLCGSADAQSVDAPRAWSDGGLLVTEGDVANCPYHIVLQVEANVHRDTIFGKRPDIEKVVKEMRERVRKEDVDAIVRADFSPDHATAVWGSVVTGTGKAIKFVNPCPSPEIVR